jgi:hypothetical protein
MTALMTGGDDFNDGIDAQFMTTTDPHKLASQVAKDCASQVCN